MCGIAGIAGWRERPYTDLTERLQQMSRSMIHRGPDDGDVIVDDKHGVGFANRRLAIRDLSPAGHMPMCNDLGTVTITYNGEIYNAKELRAELERLDYSFRGGSDTEVILHGYEAWGADCVRRLRGMFAFAIHDTRSDSPCLLLARDRLGIKPIYYSIQDGRLIFASELATLRAAGLVSLALDPVGLVGFLCLGAVPWPWTIYAGVRALPPATVLTWAGNSAKEDTYWEWPASTTEPRDYREVVERVRSELDCAVRGHLVSDVPLGAFLSGGLDSSAVVALMRKATNGTIRTCSISFQEPAFDEGPYARAMAKAIGSEHHERVVTAADVRVELPNILDHMDQPSVDGINTYFVSKVAREAGLTVALSGLGGDELFGGYPNTFGGVPAVLRGLRAIRAVPGGSAAAQLAFSLLPDDRRWRRLADAARQEPSAAAAYMSRRGLFAPAEVQSLVTPDVWAAAVEQFEPYRYVAQWANAADDFAWVSQTELRAYTGPQLLRDTDVMSMAHSLEVRVPLLDNQLLDYVIPLPRWAKDRARPPKALLLDALGSDLPESVRQERRKMGFAFPFGVWLGGELAGGLERMLDQLESPASRRAIRALPKRRSSELVGSWPRVWALAVAAHFLNTSPLAS